MRAVRLAASLSLVLMSTASTAHAAFPGQNGQIAFSTGLTPDLFAINADGTSARPLVVRPAKDVSPQWSPDGTRVVWVSFGTGRAQMMVADADGTSAARLLPGPTYDTGPTWSPDGRSIAFAGENRPGAVADLAEIYTANADGSDLRQLTFRPLEDFSPAWSPDGTKIAWSGRESNTDASHIYVMNSDGSDQHRLTTSTVGAASPEWSPDGRQILWTSYSSNFGYEIWVANADGTGAQRVASNKKLEVYGPDWSPDGTRIVYSERHGMNQNFDVVTVRADGSDSSIVIGIGKVLPVDADWQPVAEHGAQPASLLRDGGTEDGFGGFFSQPAYLIPGWRTNGGMSVLRYGLAGFPAAASLPPKLAPAGLRQRPIGGLRTTGGKRFFFGGNSAVSTAVQDVPLPATLAEIDSGQAMATLSGLLGGKGTEPDEGTVVATFLDGAGAALGVLQLGPVTPADRSNETTFVSRMQTAKIPAGTRLIRVTLTATRNVGPLNDAYFDNLALVYTKPAAPPPTKPPDPVEPPPTKPPGTPGATSTTPLEMTAPSDVAPIAGAGRLTKLGLTPNRFAVAKGNTATIAARRARRGTRIRFTLQRAGMVSMDITRVRRGRRSVVVATFLRNGRAGANSVRFTGRFRGKRLAPGRYLLGASTTDAQGKRTKSVGARFRIVRR